MPIFNNEFTFIHIPKCGGSSIEKFMVDNGHQIKLFTSTFKTFINNHTPQHSTYKELKELNLLTEKIFTIIRSEVDRTISEFFYLKKFKPELSDTFSNFDEFLDLFLNKKNSSLFDNHNLPNKFFLEDVEGNISSDIKIFNYFDIEQIENYLGITGLNNYHELKTEKNNFVLNETQLNRIQNYFNIN